MKSAICKFVYGTAVCAVTAAWLTSASAQDLGAACAKGLSNPVTLRLAHINSETSPIHPNLVKLVDRVQAQTSGKLSFQIFSSAKLGGIFQNLEQAALGENIVFYSDPSSLATAGVPEYNVLSGPFLIDSIPAGQKLVQSPLVQGWNEQLAKKGSIRVLALNWMDSPRSILGRSKFFTSPSDLAGVKMRIPQAPAYLRTFEALKAVTLSLPFSEVYLALQQGVVDALEGGVRGMSDANLMEAAKFVTLTDHMRVPYGFAMSEDRYQRLPKDCQELLKGAFVEQGKAYSDQMDAITRDTISELKTKGVRFETPDIDAYRNATASFYNAFPEWPAGLVDQVRATMK